ncbi:GNAT family N-acetyltransferase [Anaerorhabdus sp.]|uniref:GNAT family N-acetyltransferase n=1 Tax=Anaerorhabdus sp. TaxID=1872524 RepID=UPI002FC6576A
MNLMKDIRKNCNLLHLQTDPMVIKIYESEHSLLMYKKDMDCYFIASEDDNEYDELMSYVDYNFCKAFCIQEEALCKYIPGMDEGFKCCNYFYEKDSIDFEHRDDLEIRLLDESYFDFVMENYHGYDDEKYIMNRLISGNIYGAFKEEICCGFIGYHDEGAMGILVVIDEFKKQGIGTYLESFLIKKTLDDNRYPFCQVSPNNDASIHLQNKLGLKPHSNIITWGNIEGE